jgi:hypothetical protein
MKLVFVSMSFHLRQQVFVFADEPTHLSAKPVNFTRQPIVIIAQNTFPQKECQNDVKVLALGGYP